MYHDGLVVATAYARSPARSSRICKKQQLGDTWRDQEHQKYGQEFEQTMRVLAQFMHSSDEHIPFLLRKASRLREYLSQR